MDGWLLTIGEATQWLAARLVSGSIQGAVVIGALWLVCRRWSSLPASFRATLWWLASLKLVLSLLSLPPIPLPILSPVPAAETAVASTGPVSALSQAPSSVHVVPVVPSIASSSQVWITAAIGLWIVAVLLHVARLMLARRVLRQVSARARPVDEAVTVLVTGLADRLALRTTTEVRLSDDIQTPQVVGIWRPTVLLPADGFHALTGDERAMVLCHELAHVRRRDLLWGWVPTCAERLFFFHPLARLAAREYLIAREAACDAAVLTALGLAPRAYGQMLVRLGIAGTEPGFSAAGSSKSARSLKRRLDMLRHSVAGGPRRAMWVVGGLIAFSMVPVQLVARSELTGRATAPGAIAAPAVDEPRRSTIPTVTFPTSPAKPGAAQQSGITSSDGVGTNQARAAVQAELEAREAEMREQLKRIIEHETQRAVEQERSQREALLRSLQQPSHSNVSEHLLPATEVAHLLQAEPLHTSDVLRERLNELNAQMRELERTLRQQSLNQEAQRTSEAEESLRKMMKLIAAASASRDQLTVIIDQQATLEQQVEQWQQSREQVERRMEEIARQQETLRAAQQKLEAEAARLRAAVAAAKPVTGKPEAAKPEVTPAAPKPPVRK